MGKFNRLDDPTIYQWTLDENSTRYDYPRAWPSSDDLYKQFAILAAVNAVVATGVLIFLIAFWRSPAVYGNNFNLYLFFIALPDFLVSFFCLLTCAMSAPQKEFFSERMCGFQAFYLCWAFASNAWLNGVITFQVHKLLTQSNIRMRYKPPTKKLICMQAAAVYLYAALWGCINSFGAGIHADFPHQSHLYYGFACHGMEHDKSSAFFFWLCFIPLYMGIPLCYACYVMFDIWYRGLLPPSGRRRNISIFLLRLCFLYFAIWFPYLLLSLVGNFVIVNNWLLWSGAAASHLQGLISVFFCMSNEDIYKAVWSTVFCRTVDDNNVRRSTVWGILRLSRNPLTTSVTGSNTGTGHGLSSRFASWRHSFNHQNSSDLNANSGDLSSLRNEAKLSHFSSEGGQTQPLANSLASQHSAHMMNAIEEGSNADVDMTDIDVEECHPAMMKKEEEEEEEDTLPTQTGDVNNKEDTAGCQTAEDKDNSGSITTEKGGVKNGNVQERSISDGFTGHRSSVDESGSKDTEGPLGSDDGSDGSSHGHPSTNDPQNEDLIDPQNEELNNRRVAPEGPNSDIEQSSDSDLKDDSETKEPMV